MINCCVECGSSLDAAKFVLDKTNQEEHVERLNNLSAYFLISSDLGWWSMDLWQCLFNCKEDSDGEVCLCEFFREFLPVSATVICCL